AVGNPIRRSHHHQQRSSESTRLHTEHAGRWIATDCLSGATPATPSRGGMAMTETTLANCSCYWYEGQYCEECADDFFSLPCLCDPESNYVCPPCYEAVVAVLIGGRDHRATRRRPTNDAHGAARTGR